MLTVKGCRPVKRLLLPKGAEWGPRLSRISLTKEVKEKVDKRYEEDEARAVGWMSAELSRSRAIFQEMNVNRSIVDRTIVASFKK